MFIRQDLLELKDEIEQPCSSRTMFEKIELLKENVLHESKLRSKFSKPKTIFSTDDEEIELFGDKNKREENEILEDTQENETSKDQTYVVDSNEENEENNLSSGNVTPTQRRGCFNDINEGLIFCLL